MNNFFFTGMLPGWSILLIALGLGALLIYQFVNLKKHVTLYRRCVLIFLRGLVYAVLIFFLFGPGLVEEQATRLRRPLTLMLDTSKSMSLPEDPDQTSGDGRRGKTRIDLVKEKLLKGEDPLIRRLAQDYDLRTYQFGTSLETIGPDSIAHLTAHGKGTRLFEALRTVQRDAGSRGAVILFSDGIANGEKKSIDEPASFPLPLFTVAVGETKGFKDLRIADLKVPQFAFRGREVKLEFTVQAFGLKGNTVPIYFNRRRNLISTRSITIGSDPFDQRITLTYTPKELGPHSFILSLPLQAGEQITQNNQRAFKIDVQRDKIRVLSLSGTPSWNYRFLRIALKQDPFVDLVSFVFLRAPTDSVDVPENQLSLIPFPIDEVFLEELQNFDLLLFDNFSYRSYFKSLYLEKIRDFVRDGGGLAMLGGANSFDSGGYSKSPLREVLPVELEGKGRYQTGVHLQGVLTTLGKVHPITRLLPDARANDNAWKKLPSLRSLNKVFHVRGETLLIAAPKGTKKGSPLLAVGRFGKGRTLAFLSDDLWRWNFTAVGKKESPQNHLKLIRQAVRWLVQEPSYEQVKIRSIDGSREPGQKIDFKIQVLKDDFSPTPNAELRLWVIDPEGEKIPVKASLETIAGKYSATFTPTKEGAYRLQAEAHLGGKLLGKDRKTFSVAIPYGETEDGRPRPDLLQRIAKISGGDFIPISRWNEQTLERLRAKLESLNPSEIIERRQIPLWNSLWVFIPILLLLGSEWWLRRKWGLV
ncbi:MAG: glutamine amidotransferase [Candidatus Binatia bacterium]